ncbi:IclR family transcriptional regulator [Bosea sp. NBC_00550]|uniref:IclR family transcriptional regulator n=1 Tax=Bosea sp. NBC_00550 TaxID=2969621 RepID=UPI00222F5A28|nr:IclR family transcriptional regulator [Bosea sp. NBC_00550]UZF94952.1 IclR family transcriptional regulator [Bosea sp. NBC_00550]
MDVNSQVKSAVRVLDCLEVLSTADAGLSLGEIARLLDAPKSSTLMLLRTLVDRAYVMRDAYDRYLVNPALRQHDLGWIGGPLALMVRLALPVMGELTRCLQETSHLSALTSDNRVRMLTKVVSPREIRYDADLGQLRVAHRTASGRVLLAHSPAGAVSHYLQLHRDVDKSTFLADLETVRAEGIALNIDQWAAGATGISAPVFSPSGAIAGALTVGAVTVRFLADRDEIIGALKSAAAEVTGRLAAAHAPLRRDGNQAAADAKQRQSNREKRDA